MKIITYKLIKTFRRLTFDILEQKMEGFCGATDDDYVTHRYKNVEIISRSRMDIQTDRLWLRGCGEHMRSGSMVFTSDEKRDRMFRDFEDALMDWAVNSDVNPHKGNEHYKALKTQVGDTFTIELVDSRTHPRVETQLEIFDPEKQTKC